MKKPEINVNWHTLYLDALEKEIERCCKSFTVYNKAKDLSFYDWLSWIRGLISEYDSIENGKIKRSDR